MRKNGSNIGKKNKVANISPLAQFQYVILIANKLKQKINGGKIEKI